ncbi:flavodoxin family protein [Pontibacter anaerobius]|uniref:NAD(P)H-dependent oxidoreductase n=1 Tax=Pontibacter anaerobius TaxID=2993940 RepID=A0ABT3RBM3_9BACT|nr:NAD(P)H-dependent oxidoreductase [Pontibacter anaerobius]MCX2739268.1 NAD(P)H-dependent oxidoreductase [Pontibacter anaerobius]
MATATAQSSATTTPLVILASARQNSDTQLVVRKVLADQKYKLVNLMDHHIMPYTYKGVYAEEDEFTSIAGVMLQHDKIIFATPVYWYSMSGMLKNFFDRLTDLVTIHKELGRQMEGKKVYLLAVGTDEKLPFGFEEPFRLTAAYFDMHYNGCYYSTAAQLHASNLPKTASFVEQVYT